MAAPAGMEGVSHHPPVMLFSNQTVGRGLAALALGASTVLAVQAAEMGAHSGMFQKAEAPVSGSFMIKTEAGKQVLVLSSDFKTNDSAPDLKVAFSPSAKPLAMSKPPKYELKAGSYTVLAPLKSSKGAQRYVIPASIDLSKQKSVLIWCQKFNATMAWAPIQHDSKVKDSMMK
ncbi:DM13 domain-containing protein [Synechococcus sp. WH 5701]|uniref:DM13 domain-containing protein n=2 Tax=Synechococcus TaxID=1129 RepID=UPI0012E9B656|nr:DM13 domain-containing protein [Synechococcus sp. WH 5701]